MDAKRKGPISGPGLEQAFQSQIAHTARNGLPRWDTGALFDNFVRLIGAMRHAEATVHRRVHRPWDSYESLDPVDGFQAKRLILLPGASISLQCHRHRSEHWVVVRGRAEVTRGEEVFGLRPNESTYIPTGTIHRLHNPGDVKATYADIEESQNDLGFEPRVTIEEGLPRFVDWDRNYHGI
jgi:mannose-1-phosphate guanylyltransferase/mannose-6-phosphate isomerase